MNPCPCGYSGEPVQGGIYTIESQTKLENGTVRIPEEHTVRLRQEGIGATVREILCIPGQELDVDYAERLM